MAGIPDICSRKIDKSIPYEENWFDTSLNKTQDIQLILDNIMQVLSSIQCKVIFIPITTMNIEKWNTHRLYVKKTKMLLMKSEYPIMQSALNVTIHDINKHMTELNNSQNLATPFIQSYVHKSTGNKIRYAFAKLEDGVHPSQNLIKSWIIKIAKTMSENESKFFTGS